MWRMTWRNRSSAVINVTLQVLVIYRYRLRDKGEVEILENITKSYGTTTNKFTTFAITLLRGRL